MVAVRKLPSWRALEVARTIVAAVCAGWVSDVDVVVACDVVVLEEPVFEMKYHATRTTIMARTIQTIDDDLINILLRIVPQYLISRRK